MIFWMIGMAFITLTISWAFVKHNTKRMLDKLEGAPSKDEVNTMIQIASLTMKAEMSKEIAQTRHDLRQELQAMSLSVSAKLDAQQSSMTAMQSCLARIEGVMSSIPKRHNDTSS